MLGRYRHAYLLASLTLLIIGRPFLPDIGQGLITAMLVLGLVMAAAASATTRMQVWIGLALTCVILGASVSRDTWEGSGAAIIADGLGVIYWTYTSGLILNRIFLESTEVTVDTINGALCVYLMLGVAWAQGYSALAGLEPGSFSFNGELIEPGTRAFDRFLSFSFVTLTTLGYGNVLPMTAKAEALAVAEAIMGQLYVAVLLARLVALEIEKPAGHAR